jgi:hypothetical protein
MVYTVQFFYASVWFSVFHDRFPEHLCSGVLSCRVVTGIITSKISLHTVCLHNNKYCVSL